LQVLNQTPQLIANLTGGYFVQILGIHRITAFA
jgi:hypothetical protein